MAAFRHFLAMIARNVLPRHVQAMLHALRQYRYLLQRQLPKRNF
jgi:hypothetical protein